jgi:predicted nucleic acid-binding protein
MSRIYLDACSIIYLIEAASPFQETIVRRLGQLQNDPASRLLTSRLSFLECRVRPLKENDQAVLATSDGFFSASRLQVVEVTAEVIESATAFRARYGFKTPDAIHLASAVEGGADLFLTGDSSLARCSEVSVELLESS